MPFLIITAVIKLPDDIFAATGIQASALNCAQSFRENLADGVPDNVESFGATVKAVAPELMGPLAAEAPAAPPPAKRGRKPRGAPVASPSASQEAPAAEASDPNLVAQGDGTPAGDAPPWTRS
jgi:hypothetical protein